MQVVSVLSRKGGVGKTTLASNLAAAFKRKKYEGALIDLDPEGSLNEWKEAATGLPETYDVRGPDLAETLSALSSRCEIVWIDAPVGEESLLTAAQISDLLCIPVRMGEANLSGAKKTLDLIRRNPTKERATLRIIRTQRRPHTSYKATDEALRALSVDVMDAEFSMRVAYQRAKNRHCSVFDLSDSQDAEKEVASVAYGIQRLLDGLPSPTCVDERVSEAKRLQLHYESIRSGRTPSEVVSALIGTL